MKFNKVTILIFIAVYSVNVFASPFAAEVIDFSQGPGATEDYDLASTVLGAPPVADSFAGSMNIDYAPWETTEVVSLGNGGSITIKYDHMVMNNDIDVEYGIDLIVFGNSFFSTDWEGDYSIIGAGFEPATIEVSQDGITFYEIAGVYADDLYPYTSLKNDFIHATPAGISYMGRQVADVLLDFQNGCGGAQVDISSAIGTVETLEWIQYVRVTDIAGDAGIADVVAFADVVPEPAAFMLLGLGTYLIRRKK